MRTGKDETDGNDRQEEEEEEEDSERQSFLNRQQEGEIVAFAPLELQQDEVVPLRLLPVVRRGLWVFSLLAALTCAVIFSRIRVTSPRSNKNSLHNTNGGNARQQLSCTWAPGKDADCLQAIQALVCQQNDTDNDDDSNKIPRLLLFGDSTMDRLFRWGGLQDTLVMLDKKHMIKETGLVKCKVRNWRDRCHLNEQFGLAYPINQTWIPPATNNHSIFEGPRVYGLEHPFCQDCRGCFPSKLECLPLEQQSTNSSAWDIILSTLTTQSQKKGLVYGGFLGVEYARDVEIQTDQFRTTQENVAYYLARLWNSPNLLRVWQKPTCLVNTAHHDAVIPGITIDDYIANVQWYLLLLQRQCRRLLWLGATAPKDDSYKQKIETTQRWGLQVRKMLAEDLVLREKSLYIDVFAASREFPHHDNLHMEKEWYKSLSTLFREESFLNCPV